jgi:AcrR family transcriptional regulator
VTTAPSAKPTRSERNEEVRRRLFAAAAQVVGMLGYAEASVARITELAGVAQGTFYNHFPTRQSLLDELLPTLGLKMAQWIEARTAAIRPEYAREIARFRAFFDYLGENPGFLRILNEAEFAAPAAYRQHIDNIAAPYRRMLARARERGEVAAFSDAELEVVVHMLLGARSYLSQMFSRAQPADDALFTAYAKLLERGLFKGAIRPEP